MWPKLSLVGISLALGLALGGPAPASPPPKVDPGLWEALGRGEAEFLVLLEEQADLSSARAARSKPERGRRAVAALRETASRTQGPIVEGLRQMRADFKPFWVSNFIRVRGGRDAAEWLAARADVRVLEPNPRVRGVEPQPDGAPDIGEAAGAGVEWGVSQIGADAVWALGYDGAGVVIGGQDTGYEWDHPALRDAYLGWDGSRAVHDYHWHDAIHSGGGDCGANSPTPCDDYGHGTHTMGTMVGDDGGANRIGVAPGARWIGCRNMDEGDGTPSTYAECFQWFLAPTDGMGANADPARAPDVINNSWVCTPSEGCTAATLRTVVENARAAGIVVVASAGNSGSGCSTVDAPPAIYEAAFTVGATNSSDGIAGFSSRGPVTIDSSLRLKPDVTAPGVGVRSAVRGGGYASLSGTSMAGPHVAGLVALLLDARPDLAGDVDTIETLIELSALPRTTTQVCGAIDGTAVPNNTFGYGRVDAIALLTADADEDGEPNLSDCRPTDSTTWAAPSAVTSLRISGGPNALLEWMPPAAPGASAIDYDVLRSVRVDDFSAAECLAVEPGGTSALDAATPATLYAYLVRATNPCGETLGTASDGAVREGAACP